MMPLYEYGKDITILRVSVCRLEFEGSWNIFLSFSKKLSEISPTFRSNPSDFHQRRKTLFIKQIINKQITIMSSGRTVLVAVDGSADADKAFDYACTHTGPNDKIHVVTATAENPDFLFTGVYQTNPQIDATAMSQKVLAKYAVLCQVPLSFKQTLTS
jgi:hypothetical protein